MILHPVNRSANSNGTRQLIVTDVSWNQRLIETDDTNGNWHHLIEMDFNKGR